MNAFVALALASALGVAALFVALVVVLGSIVRELEAIGGPTTLFRSPPDYLAKIRLGLRAIEVETGGLAPQVTKLNGGLGAVLDGLKAVDRDLGATLDAVGRQAPR